MAKQTVTIRSRRRKTGDNSGYVLASQYVAPPTDNSYVMTMEERMEATEEAILDIYSMLGSDL